MLIVIEGIDGSGKSTLAKDLARQLELLGANIVLTREPGGSKLGKNLRTILQTQPVPVCPVAEFLLFAADRAQHFDEVVVPALRENKIVISDRMGDSSIVYQGYGRGIDKEKIMSVNEWAMQNIKPDLIIYLRISPAIAQQRLCERKKLTVFEKEQAIIVNKLIEAFETLYKNRDDVTILDGTQTPQEVTQHALKAIQLCINKQAPFLKQIPF